MTSLRRNIKNLSKKRKIRILSIAILLGIILITNIEPAYAYYNDSNTSSVFANLIGDFSLGTDDVNIMIYQKNTAISGTHYKKVNAIPSTGSLNSSLTTCTEQSNNTSVNCSYNGSSGDCYYSFDTSARKFKFNSNKKITCKVYFN